MAATTQAQGWHVAQWGFWGWLETAVKLVGIGAGIMALVNSFSAPDFILGGNPRLAAVLLMGLFLLISLGIIVMRIQQREIIAVIFSILNAIGHIGVFVALLRQPTETGLPLIFAIAFILGELVKQQFIIRTGYTESGRDTKGMLNFFRGVLVTYIVLAVLLVI